MQDISPEKKFRNVADANISRLEINCIDNTHYSVYYINNRGTLNEAKRPNKKA